MFNFPISSISFSSNWKMYSCPISFAVCFALLWNPLCWRALCCSTGVWGWRRAQRNLSILGHWLCRQSAHAFRAGKTADALVTKVSKGKGKVFSSLCPLPRYFAWLSHEKLPFCSCLCLKNTSKLLLGWAPRFCWLENARHTQSA